MTLSRRLRPTEWTPKAIQRLERTNNPISRALDYWLNSLLEGVVTKFAVDMLKDYNEAKCYFFKGYDCKYLKLSICKAFHLSHEQNRMLQYNYHLQ